MQVTVDCTTRAPAEIAYATHLDVMQWPRFVRGIEKVEMLTQGPPRVGSRFRETRLMFGKRASEEMTIAQLVPPQRQVLTAENHGTRYTATATFTPQDGGTLIRLRFEGAPVSLLARMMSGLAILMAGTVRKQLQADLDDVAAEADRRAGAG